MIATEDVAQLFQLTRANAFALGRLSALRSLAIGLTKSRRDLGDADAAAEFAERLHLATHELIVQLFSIGARSGVEIRTVVQAQHACAQGQLGPYPAYLAGSLIESEWYLDRASLAYRSQTLGVFAQDAVEEIRKRTALQLERESTEEMRAHAWIPPRDELAGTDAPASMYTVTSGLDDTSLWLSDVGQHILQQACEAHFTPVPDAQLEADALAGG